ncbi:Uncharacterised protein [Achromobacter sp. 2789STDY5608628]|nr:Uncharacterised protein [Achromobacter sp. 2789STDY5608628]
MADQPLRQQFQLAHAHVERQRLAFARQRRPIQVVLVLAAVRRHQAHRLRVLAVRQRNAGIGRTGQRRGDAGHHLVAHAVRAQVFQFLAAAAEDEGVAALEPHHAAAQAGVLDQQGVDARLGRVMVLARQFAHRDAFGVAARQRHDVVADQPVVQDHVGLVQRAQRLQRQQAGIAGAGADQHHAALGRRQRLGQGGLQRGFSVLRALLAQQAGHGAVQQPVIEAAPRAQVGVAGADALAVAFGQAGQAAQAVVEQGFDAFAQAPRQHRRHARRGNGDDDRRAVDDGRHLERRQFRIVHHVAEDAASPRGVGDRRVDAAVIGGGHRQPRAIKPGGVEAARQVADAARRQQLRQRRRQLGRANGDIGMGFEQGERLALGHRAAAHDQHGPVFQIGKYREKLHHAASGAPGRRSNDHRDRVSSPQLLIS